MQACALRPNVATYNSLISGAVASDDFARAWRTVDMMETSKGGPGVDAYTMSILFKGYKGKRHVMDAESFDRALALIQRYNVKVDEVLVNVTLEACVSLRDPGRLASTLNAFKRSGWAMPKQCAMHTYATLIKAYGQSHQLGQAWKIWQDVTETRGLVASEQLYGQMIDVLVTNGRLDDALSLFREMKKVHAEHLNSQGFAVAYAMIIKGFAQRKECAKALECYAEMREQEAKVGLVVFNTLIDACSRVGDMDAAARLFRDMIDAECGPDLITYSTLIKGYCIRGELDQAMELFALMRRKGIRPDAIVFNSLLDGCAKKLMPGLCEQVVRDMEEAGVAPSNYSASILIKLYGRCKDVNAAFRVVDEMPRKHGFRPNTAVYTCLMSTCIANNRLDQAMELRVRMIGEGTHPDEKTYSTLLRGALRAGSVERCVLLVDAALDQDQGGRRLLDEELVQSVLILVQKRRAWEEYGRALQARLQETGLPAVAQWPSAGADQVVKEKEHYQRWGGGSCAEGGRPPPRRRGPPMTTRAGAVR
jgi:pentatricopeptide repeat protein